MKWVICWGNPFNGLSLEGPFDSPQEAGDYAAESAGRDTWLIIAVSAPDEEEER